MWSRKKQLIIVRGGGDIATGTIHRLHRCGYPVMVLETGYPSAIRRQVAFSEAVYDGTSQVEGTVCVRVKDFGEAKKVLKEGDVPLMVDPDCQVLKEVRPWALVDAILAKKNLGSNRQMADKTIALGPGFYAGRDVDLVVETMRGHNLGRLIGNGEAQANTGVPGVIAGYGKERVIHSPAGGILLDKVHIGDKVKKGDVLIQADIEGIKNEGYDIITPMVICNTQDFEAVEGITGIHVYPGEDCLKIRKE